MQIYHTLFGRRDSYEALKECGRIEFISTSFIRGMSFDDAIIIVDECQNMTFEEETKLSGFSAAPVKNEGSAIAYDNAQEAFTARYTHETIAMGFSLTEEAIEDNLYDSLSARYTKALARAMAYTKQVKAAAMLAAVAFALSRFS